MPRTNGLEGTTLSRKESFEKLSVIWSYPAPIQDLLQAPRCSFVYSRSSKHFCANDALPLQPSLPQLSSYAQSYRDDWEESIRYIASVAWSSKYLLRYDMCLPEL